MALRPPHETFVRSAADLFQLWQDMMGGGGFGGRQLWMIAIAADGELCPAVQIVDDVPVAVDAEMLRGLTAVVADFAADGISFAFLLARPGPGTMDDVDRRWARALLGALGSLARWPVHLATYERVRVFAPDDLLAA